MLLKFDAMFNFLYIFCDVACIDCFNTNIYSMSSLKKHVGSH